MLCNALVFAKSTWKGGLEVMEEGGGSLPYRQQENGVESTGKQRVAEGGREARGGEAGWLSLQSACYPHLLLSQRVKEGIIVMG